MTKKIDLKREITHDIRQMRDILNNMEEYVRAGNPKHMAMVATFFHVLRYHLKDGDLSPESIDLTLNLKHQEFLKTQHED